MQKFYSLCFIVVADPHQDENYKIRMLHSLKRVPGLQEFDYMEMRTKGSCYIKADSLEAILNVINRTFGHGPLSARFADSAEKSASFLPDFDPEVIVLDTRVGRPREARP